MSGSGSVAFLEFLLAAARARIVAANILQRIAYRVMAMVAVRPVNMRCMVMLVIVVAIGAVHVGFVVHEVSLLRDKVAGDYLAIGGDVHAPPEHQTSFQLTIQTIGNRPVRLLEQAHDVLHVPPEIGVNGHFVIVEAMTGHRRPTAGLAARQLDVVEMNSIDQATYRQALLIGIVDAKTQHELLLEESRFDDLDIGELNPGVLEITAEPGRTTRKARQQT